MTATATNNGLEVLDTTGMFVWWELRDSRVTPDDLRAILDDEGFTPAKPVPDIDPASGITRACGEWSQGRGKQDRYRAEVTRRDGGITTVGLLTRRRVDAKEVAWTQVGIAEHDQQTDTWTMVSDAPEHDGAMASFKEAAEMRMRFLDHRWIRPNVLAHAMERAQAMNLRSGSGFYFAPRQHMEEMRRLRRVVRRIGGSSLRLAVVGSDPDTVESVTEATRDNMVAAINGVQEQLKGWADSKRKVRSDSQANVLEQLAGLISVAETYEAALGVRLDDLRSDIEGARRRALSLIADRAA